MTYHVCVWREERSVKIVVLCHRTCAPAVRLIQCVRAEGPAAATQAIRQARRYGVQFSVTAVDWAKQLAAAAILHSVAELTHAAMEPDQDHPQQH